MNLVNRVVVVLGLLTTMVLSAILFIATEPVLQTLILFLQQVEANLMAVTGPRIFLRWVGGLILIFLVWAICAALLWLEIRRPRVKTIKVQEVSGGSAELTADSITNRLEYNIDQLADVIKVRPTINSGRKGVKVALAVETSPEIDVPGKTEEIQVLTRDIVENRMGLQLDTVRVVLRHTPYSKSVFRGRKAKAAVQPAEGALVEAQLDVEQASDSWPGAELAVDAGPDDSPGDDLFSHDLPVENQLPPDLLGDDRSDDDV